MGDKFQRDDLIEPVRVSHQGLVFTLLAGVAAAVLVACIVWLALSLSGWRILTPSESAALRQEIEEPKEVASEVAPSAG